MAERNEEIYQQRLAKLSRWKERGVDPYPARFHRTHTAADAKAQFEQAYGQEPGAHGEDEVAVAGRITAHRTMGRASFLDLRDVTDRIQVYFRADHIGQDAYQQLEDLDLGDLIGV